MRSLGRMELGGVGCSLLFLSSLLRFPFGGEKKRRKKDPFGEFPEFPLTEGRNEGKMPVWRTSTRLHAHQECNPLGANAGTQQRSHAAEMGAFSSAYAWCNSVSARHDWRVSNFRLVLSLECGAAHKQPPTSGPNRHTFIRRYLRGENIGTRERKGKESESRKLQ